MRKLFLFIFFIFLTSILFSQNKIVLKGLIIDQENFPIPYTGVGIINKNIGTTSTEEGTFYFVITNKEVKDTLEISSMGYITFKIRVADFLSQKSTKIVLKEKTTELSEISLMTTEDYIKNALKNLKKNSVSKNHQLKILYRRWSVEDNICRFYIEHFMNVIDKGPSSYMTRYSIQESRKSSEYRFIKNLQNRHAVEYMEMNNPLRRGVFFNDYKWKKIKNSSYDGEDVLVVKGTNGNDNTLTLYIGYDSFKIYQFEIVRKPPRIGDSLKAIYIYKKNKNSKLYLSYHTREWKSTAKISKNIKKLLVQKNKNIGDYIPMAFRHEVFVLELEEDKKSFETFKSLEKMDMTLYKVPYNANFWEGISLPPETKFYKKNIGELESLFSVPISTQFKYSN
tara:strand:- start:6936 stop:8120 length:1185 start_codon:yes stop_codon:yes gene_type:complete